EGGQGVDDADEGVAHQAEGVAHEDQVGVVGDVAGGGAEVEDVAGGGGGVAVGVDVGHDVVPQPALVHLGAGEVDVVDVGPQLGELPGGDAGGDAVVFGQAQLGLGLGEGDPEPAPGGELLLRAPERGHLGAGVAGDQGVVIDRKGIHGALSLSCPGRTPCPG